MNNHSFNKYMAVEYGMNAAVLFENIMYWCEHNQANGKHYHDGMYWTYNTAKAFTVLFPYMTERQIRTALKKLEENGLVVTGNYNADRRDRTVWYAVTENGKCIYQKCQMQVAKMSNASDTDVTALPDINNSYKPTVQEEEELTVNDVCTEHACEDEPVITSDDEYIEHLCNDQAHAMIDKAGLGVAFRDWFDAMLKEREHPTELILHAAELTVRRHEQYKSKPLKEPIMYAEHLLYGWKRDGITSVDELEDDDS